jgi:hypothetical protein
MKAYRFYKDGNRWYIDLPEYITEGGNLGDLQMVAGADTMLDLIAQGKAEVSLLISLEAFAGADEVILTEKCDPYLGGGYYFMKQYNGKEINQSMWLCQVTQYVFNDKPPRIYIAAK